MRLTVLGFGLAVGFISSGASSAAPAPALAEPALTVDALARPGPYPVGVRTLVLVDASREDDPYSEKGRRLIVDVWYPAVDAAASERPTSFSAFFGEHRAAAEMFVEHFGGELEAVDERFETKAVRGAGIREGRFPILVFSHGNGGVRQQNASQLDHLASHGYVIASPDHTGNAGVTPLPERAVPYDRKGRTRSAKDRPLDVSFVIDRLLAESADPSSWLAARLDAREIGVLGHSFGGFTATRVAETDPRVKAILPMTVAYGKEATIPLMLMLGEQDRTMREPGNAVARMYWVASRGPKHLFSLRRGGHFTFTDMDRINPAFGDGIGKDRETGGEFLPLSEAKPKINAYSLAFFDCYLKHSARAQRFLASGIDDDELRFESEAAAVDSSTASNAGVPAAAAQDKERSDAPRAAASGAAVRKRVLIISGADVPAHDWRTTTPVTRASIEENEALDVRVCEDAAILETKALHSYDVVVLNYRNNPAEDPGERARENLTDFVRGGKGLVVLHFGVYAFAGWDEYAKIIGRVWVGRVSGEKVSGHGPRGKFAVRVAAKEHPVVAGIEAFEADDELYAKLVGDAPIDVLLEADSDWSGRTEPIAWVRRYGEGRVFVTVLGHDVRSREISAVGRLVRQGVEWAAGFVGGGDGQL